MLCGKCACENRDSAKFCTECGASLAARCPRCGAENHARSKFCVECGASLHEGTPAPRTTLAQPAPGTDGERRHLTVLFCDLVSSTEIAAHLDPEQWHAIAADYQGTAAEAVGLWSIRYFRRWKPSLLSGSIERNRVIWKAVLGTGNGATAARTEGEA